MRQFFVVKDKVSGSYCQSTKFGEFNDFSKAILFTTLKSAKRAKVSLTKGPARPYSWVNGEHRTLQNVELEVAEYTITPIA